MMKIKTFKLGEDTKINKFLADVRPIQNGITVGNETVTIQYFEGKHPEFTNADKEAKLAQDLAQFTKKVFDAEQELVYREIAGEFNSPSEMNILKKDIEKNKKYIEHVSKQLEELA